MPIMLLDVAARRIYDIRENRDVTGFESLKDIMGRTVNELAALARGKPREKTVMTGFHSLDKILGGLRPGGLIIVAARPAMGKSAFALNIAQKAATLYNVPAAVFSLEMSKDEIGNRMLSTQSLVNSRSLEFRRTAAAMTGTRSPGPCRRFMRRRSISTTGRAPASWR